MIGRIFFATFGFLLDITVRIWSRNTENMVVSNGKRPEVEISPELKVWMGQKCEDRYSIRARVRATPVFPSPNRACASRHVEARYEACFEGFPYYFITTRIQVMVPWNCSWLRTSWNGPRFWNWMRSITWAATGSRTVRQGITVNYRHQMLDLQSFSSVVGISIECENFEIHQTQKYGEVRGGVLIQVQNPFKSITVKTCNTNFLKALFRIH